VRFVSRLLYLEGKSPRYPLGGYVSRVILEDIVCNIGGCIQKVPDWPLGARTANHTALCH
jgi:hypothetical protein